MLRAYAFGLFSAALAVLLVAAVWIGTQPKQEAGLLWGDRIYTSREEFNVYLGSKGLSYKVWLARNPGAAPWETDRVTVGGVTVPGSKSVVQLLLPVVAWMLSAAGLLLLLKGARSGTPAIGVTSGALFTALMVGIVAVGIWASTQSKVESALAWGGASYTSKEEFETYLESRGSSYEVWLSRHPGLAPWEPVAAPARTTASVPEVARRPAAARDVRAWVGPTLLVAGASLLSAGSALLLVRRRRGMTSAVVSAESSGSGAASVGGRSRVGQSVVRVAGYLGAAESSARDRLSVSVPVCRRRLVTAARECARLLLAATRTIDRHDARFEHLRPQSLVLALAAGIFAVSAAAVGLFVAYFFSSV